VGAGALFGVGDFVLVAPRTHPGANKPGGVGRVTAVHGGGAGGGPGGGDEGGGGGGGGGATFDVRFVLGGSERGLGACLLTAHNVDASPRARRTPDEARPTPLKAAHGATLGATPGAPVSKGPKKGGEDNVLLGDDSELAMLDCGGPRRRKATPDSARKAAGECVRAPAEANPTGAKFAEAKAGAKAGGRAASRASPALSAASSEASVSTPPFQKRRRGR